MIILMFVFFHRIVFEAGYFLQDRAFFNNIGTILLYAVVVRKHSICTIIMIMCCHEFEAMNAFTAGSELGNQLSDNAHMYSYILPNTCRIFLTI